MPPNRKRILKELESSVSLARKIAVLGIGSELRADDAAGVLVAQSVQRRLSRYSRTVKARVFIGGTAPENLTGEIKRYEPSHIIIVDAADFRKRAGEIFVMKPDTIGEGVSFSTHKMPARILVDYLRRSFPCNVVFIGIQPKDISFGKSVSRAVARSIDHVSAAITELIRSQIS